MRQLLWTVAVVALVVAFIWQADQSSQLNSARAADKAKEDTPPAAKTRKKLKEKLTVEYKETRTKDVFEDIKRQLDNKISFKLDNEGGVSNNSTLTFSAKDQTLEQILDGLGKKFDFGYIVISDASSRLDGWILIKKGKERGYEITKDEPMPAKDKDKGEEPAKEKEKATKEKEKAVAKDKEKPAKEKGKDKEKEPKEKDTASKEKPAKDKEKAEEPEDKTESIAYAKLKLAKRLHKDGLLDKAKQRYKDVIKMYPDTKASKEAEQLLKDLDD